MPQQPEHDPSVWPGGPRRRSILLQASRTATHEACEDAMPVDRPTRFAADLLDDAAIEGARQSRSAKQQLDHWARLGRALDRRHAATLRSVLEGDVALSSLDAPTRNAVNASLDAAIEERAAAASLGAVALRRGIAVVALDDSGALIRHDPDGTATPYSAPRRAR